MKEYFQSIFLAENSTERIVLIALVALVLMRIVRVIFVQGRILFLKKPENEEDSIHRVSILFTIRNEEEKLKRNLPNLLAIENDDFEVIVVDDFSQDDSFLVLGFLKDRFQKLRISSINEDTRFSEKLAQNIALKGAQNEWVLFPPIATINLNIDWLTGFQSNKNIGKDFLIAYTKTKYEPKWYSFLFRIEQFNQQVKSFGYILSGVPILYSEENIAFRKEKYFEMGGYGNKINEPFANLQLLLNKLLTRKSTQILVDKACILEKEIVVSKDDFFDLLRKEIRIEKHLSWYKQLILFLDSFTKFLVWPLLVFVFLRFPQSIAFSSALITIYLVLFLFIIKMLENRLNERKIFIPSLVYNLIMPWFKLFYRWHFNRQSKKRKWRSKV